MLSAEDMRRVATLGLHKVPEKARDEYYATKAMRNQQFALSEMMQGLRVDLIAEAVTDHMREAGRSAGWSHEIEAQIRDLAHALDRMADDVRRARER
ncbi:MAG: hypothetical protein OEZ19_04715 [Paracoccaceae bacterium]|nr:hypothetical protein [Paracoccaceae bacterium]